MIMESLSDHGYSGVNDGTKVWHFLQGNKVTQLKAAVNLVEAQPEKYGNGFDATVSYLGQIFMKKGYNMQSVHVAKTKSQLAKPQEIPFTWKIKCKKYCKAVWNSMSSEQQMEVRKL